MTKTTIRPAAPEDAATVARLGALTFSETFGHLYPPSDLHAFLDATHNVEAVAAEIANPDLGVWLAETAGAAVGYAVAGPCKLPHPEVTPRCGELMRIYVLGEAMGQGLGTRLMETALAWLERDGPRRLWIGVWSGNAGAQRLYARYGFSRVGEYKFMVGDTADHEFILSRT
jgi:ribosomal protein S18 acetylase RimI-like enzyme